MQKEKYQEERAEDRDLLGRYFSVEFSLKASGVVYQFRLRDLSSHGLGILVREDSAVLKDLRVGDTLEVTYHPPQASGHGEILKTRIRHITEIKQKSVGSHFLIGLQIDSKQAAGETS